MKTHVDCAVCPYCAADLAPGPIPPTDSSLWFTCPACGKHIWHIQTDITHFVFRLDAPDTAAFIELAKQRDVSPDTLMLARAIYHGLSTHRYPVADLNDVGLDSLDLVELVMEFEDGFTPPRR